MESLQEGLEMNPGDTRLQVIFSGNGGARASELLLLLLDKILCLLYHFILEIFFLRIEDQLSWSFFLRKHSALDVNPAARITNNILHARRFRQGR